MKQKRNYIRTLVMAVLTMACCHGEVQAQQPDFSFEDIRQGNITMPFRKAAISSVPGERPAVVVYLHGGSSKGDDNTTQMGEQGISLITNYLTSNRVNALMLVPQCPKDKSWNGPMLGVIKAMIERYTVGSDARPASADATKVYIFGGSMGGTGTWSMLSAYPGLFAAAMPVAGNPSTCVAGNVARTPVFTVMGTADAIMSVSTAADFILQLQTLGDEAQMETEEGWTHEDTCTKSYTPQRLDWVFAHVSDSSAGIENIGGSHGTDTVATTYYTPDGRQTERAESHGLHIKVERHADGSVTASKVML